MVSPEIFKVAGALLFIILNAILQPIGVMAMVSIDAPLLVTLALGWVITSVIMLVILQLVVPLLGLSKERIDRAPLYVVMVNLISSPLLVLGIMDLL